MEWTALTLILQSPPMLILSISWAVDVEEGMEAIAVLVGATPDIAILLALVIMSIVDAIVVTVVEGSFKALRMGYLMEKKRRRGNLSRFWAS